MTRQDSGPSKLTQKINIPVAAGQSGPDADLPGRCDFDIRIGRDGTWYYRGSPIGRQPGLRAVLSWMRPLRAIPTAPSAKTSPSASGWNWVA